MDEETENIKINIGGFERQLLQLSRFSELEKISELELFEVIGSKSLKCEVVLDYIFMELTIYQR